MIRRQLRYRDLKERGIVNSWPQLKDRIKRDGFPPGRLLGPNFRAFDEGEVEVWLASRPSDPKPPPRRKAKAEA
jgi:predicted DNA-binding transcriptional regulator AlpA